MVHMVAAPCARQFPRLLQIHEFSVAFNERETKE
jgi:hypothetical protein